MKRKSLLIMLLVALFVPLAMNAQNRTAKRSASGSPQLEMEVSKEMPSSNPLLSRIEPAREAALEELSTIATRAVGDYELVTSEQIDWSGDYVITAMSSSTSAYVMTGKASGNNANYGAYTTVAVNNNTLSSSAVNSYKVTITEVTYNNNTYYTLKQGNYYLYMSQDGNNLWFNTSVATGNNARKYYWSISYEDDGYVKITNLYYPNTRIIRFNNQTGSRRFACYSSTSSNMIDLSLFKYNDGSCVPPTNFAATDVDMESATLSWTENGQAQYWVIYYIGENDANTSYEIATSNPFTLTGLTPATTYLALVTPYCGGLDQDSEVIEFTTEDYPCPAPTDLYADNVTNNSATLHWTSEAGSYNVQYRIPGSDGDAVFFDDFENGLDNWTTYTEGNAPAWRVTDPSSGLSWSGHNGSTYVAISMSWNNSAYTADNWLVTPQLDLGGTLKFYVYTNQSYPDDYEVKLSTGGNAVRDFTVTLQELASIPTTGDWVEVSIDLSRYAGQRGYIAIHHSFYDGNYILVDDFGVYQEGSEPGPWIPATPNGNSANLTGLNPETTYEWQLMADCGSDGQSLWSDIATFTTLSACAAPTGLSSEPLINTATLSWTGYTDAYNIQYREVDPTAPATVILTAGDIWGDGSGYQMLLDADATAFGTIIPETGPLTTSGNASATTYAEFEYKIPTNADGSLTTTNIVVNNSISIQIPAGTYDWCITNPTANDRMWIAGVNGRYDDFVFEAGKTYEFSMQLFGENDGAALTVTADWTSVSGTVTSPYTLTGLNPGTTYEWQVKGDGCDDWSAGNSFTTLNGILVESITADPVTVTIGQTANITNLEVLPADATNPAVTYTSNDETIATVDANGVVTGVAAGSTTITIAATDGSGVTATINVTVNGIDVTGITAENVTVVTGETATISYTVAPTNATDPSVTFESANTSIATVANGVVTGVNPGETTITITSVSNPEVTATITVTVTFNPDAVQFTVNAPANAQPGDVITVEAVMAAPTSGNYDGFNALLTGIYFDNTAFELVSGSITNGAVAQQAQQMGAMILSGYDVPGVAQLTIASWNATVTAEGVVCSAQFTVLDGAEGSFEFYAKPVRDAEFTLEGVFIPYEYTPSTVTIAVPEQYTRTITGYGTGTGNWYLIASPIGNVAPTEVTNMLSNNYDLFYFDDAKENEWVNYKDNESGEGNESTNPYFDLEKGKGYLYANSETVDLIFTGYALTTTEETVDLDYTAGDGVDLPGWNLVGNPFAEIAYLAGNCAFYTMDSDGNFTSTTNASIEAMEGIFVEVSATGQTLTFTTEQQAKSPVLNLNLSNGRKVIDRAIVRFDGGKQLSKLQFRQGSTKVYIPVEGHDYAVVNSEEMGEMPVSFKAEEYGTYTFSFNAEEVSFAYLHLIDNLTGADIDLLETPSYSFEAKTTDYASRFKLVFATGNASDDNFAFFSNGSFVINNEGNAELQVIDLMGRIVKSESINGCANVSVNGAAGVYMLRLVNGDNVKVQKVVVK